jgi:hypothetical protein
LFSLFLCSSSVFYFYLSLFRLFVPLISLFFLCFLFLSFSCSFVCSPDFLVLPVCFSSDFLVLPVCFISIFPFSFCFLLYLFFLYILFLPIFVLILFGLIISLFFLLFYFS